MTAEAAAAAAMIAKTIGQTANQGVQTAGGIAGLVWGAQDREYQKYLNQISQQNWERQMKFAEAQAKAQQDQFNANRIGNLTKEYTEAGLNPLLAAGMGQSTESVVGTGGTPHFTGTDASTKNLQSSIQMMNATQAMLAKAQIDKTDAEKSLIIEEAKGQAITNSHLDEKLQTDIENTIANTNLINEETLNMSYKNIYEKLVSEVYKENPDLTKESIIEQLKGYDLENKWKDASTWTQKAGVIVGALVAIFTGGTQIANTVSNFMPNVEKTETTHTNGKKTITKKTRSKKH